MGGLSLALGEARATWVLEQVSTGFQGLFFVILVCILLSNEKHFLTAVNMLGSCILFELAQLVVQSHFCTRYQDNNNKHSGFDKIH